jgi:hypothetical protein
VKRDLETDYARLKRGALEGMYVVTNDVLAEEYGVDADDLAAALYETYPWCYGSVARARAADVPRAVAVLVLKNRLDRVRRSLEAL